MNSLLKSSFLVTLIVTSLSISGQETKKSVILYNVVPLSVELVSDGTIQTIYGRADHLFKGYELVKREDQVNIDAPYGELGKNLVVSTKIQTLHFDSNVATLSQQTITSLDAIKEKLVLVPSLKILITPYNVVNASKFETLLLQNRLAACLSYLEIIGVNKSQIVIDANADGNTSAEIRYSDLNPIETLKQ